MIKFKLIFAALISIFLVGCFNDMPPACDDSETKELLLEIVREYFTELGFQGLSITATGHEMLEKHENAKEYTCEARLILKAKNKIRSEVIGYSVFSDENQKGHFIIQLYD